MRASVNCQLPLSIVSYLVMLVSVSIAAGFKLILLMVVQECCSLVELYIGICDGSIEVPSTSSRPFEFPETYKEQPFSVVVASKQLSPLQSGSEVRGSGCLWHLPEVYGRAAWGL